MRQGCTIPGGGIVGSGFRRSRYPATGGIMSIGRPPVGK
jgi:hypothetical protein